MGAGCPLSIRVGSPDASQPLIPDIKGLTNRIKNVIQSAPAADTATVHQAVLKALDSICKDDGIVSPTVEDYLNRLRNIYAVGGKDAVRGVTPDQALDTDRRICQLIKEEVDKILPAGSSPYRALARWIRGIPRTAPVEIFTPNYDLLFEQGLEECGVPFFDGFAGVRRAFLDTEAMDNNSLPAKWARLWKLHGSVNWHRDQDGNVWRGLDLGDGDLLIYPSHDKFRQSRRMPFLAMLDRLKSFLSRPEAVLVVCGYSFMDDHFNAVVREGLRGNSRSVVFGLVYGSLEENHLAIPIAAEAPNFLLLASDAAVIGGIKGTWSVPQGESTPPEFHYGNFASLGEFLNSVSGQIDGKPMIHHAAGADISGNR